MSAISSRWYENPTDFVAVKTNLLLYLKSRPFRCECNKEFRKVDLDEFLKVIATAVSNYGLKRSHALIHFALLCWPEDMVSSAFTHQVRKWIDHPMGVYYLVGHMLDLATREEEGLTYPSEIFGLAKQSAIRYFSELDSLHIPYYLVLGLPIEPVIEYVERGAEQAIAVAFAINDVEDRLPPAYIAPVVESLSKDYFV